MSQQMSQQNSVFVDRMCEEGITLAVEARNYIAYHEKRYRQNYSLPTCLRIGYQLTRVTARILQAMSWLLTYRAVSEGEMPAESLLAPEYSIQGGRECEDPSGTEVAEMPSGVRSLLERSHSFYMRVSRLDTMCRKVRDRRRAAAASSVSDNKPLLRIIDGEGQGVVHMRLLAE